MSASGHGTDAGQRFRGHLSVTANTYTHAMIDGREIDRENLLVRVIHARTVSVQ